MKLNYHHGNHNPHTQMPIHSLIVDLQHPKLSERKREIEKRESDSERAERVGEWEGLRERGEREDRVKEERREIVNKYINF